MFDAITRDGFSRFTPPMRQDNEPILLFNNAGMEIPPFAAMMLTGSFTGDYRNVRKPDADSLTSAQVVINGDRQIPDGTPFEVPAYSENLVQINGTVPGVNDDLGTVSGKWYMAKDYTGFRCRGAINGGDLAYASPFSSAGRVISSEIFDFNDSLQLVGKNAANSGNNASWETAYVPLTDPIDFSSFFADPSVSLVHCFLHSIGSGNSAMSTHAVATVATPNPLENFRLQTDVFLRYSDGITERILSNALTLYGNGTVTDSGYPGYKKISASCASLEWFAVDRDDYATHGNITSAKIRLRANYESGSAPGTDWDLSCYFTPSRLLMAPEVE